LTSAKQRRVFRPIVSQDISGIKPVERHLGKGVSATKQQALLRFLAIGLFLEPKLGERGLRRPYRFPVFGKPPGC
jgi:hypothetical protein